MRFSPVLVAVLAASATLGLSNAAKGETPKAVSLDAASLGWSGGTGQSVQSPAIGLAVDIGSGSTVEQPVSSRDRITQPQGISLPERLTEGSVAQASPAPAPATDGSPQQETPDRIQIDTTPTPTGGSEIQPETQPTPAEAQPTPAPSPVPTPTAEPEPTGEAEPRVLVSEVTVNGVTGNPEEAKLLDAIYGTIRTQPGQTTTRSQLQEDINAIFATGFFLNVRAVPEDTPLGVRVTFDVQPNPVLAVVEVQGSQVLPQSEVDKAFGPLYGKILNLVELQNSIKQINKWYQDNGFVLAQITDAPKVSEDGKVILEVAEGVVEDIQVRFLNKEGEEFVEDKEGNPVTDKDGNPVRVRGKTRPFIITREFELKPGEVFNRNKVQRDLQRVFGLNIFEDIKLSFKPGQDPRKVVVSVDVTERNTGSVAAGAGISSASGLFGTLSYQEQNFGGNNQKLGAEVQLGIRELLFDLSFTDPWIANDPYRTSYTLNAFRRRTISLIFDGGDTEVELPNGDRPRVNRIGSGISFVRPLAKNPFVRSEWTASLGLQYQRVSIRDSDGDLAPKDELGNDLSFSGEGKDDLVTVQLGIVRDRRDNALRPIKGSLMRLGTEQSVPIGVGNIFFNRLRGTYSYYMPTQLLRVTKGCRATQFNASECPQTFAFNIQAGTVVGDLPPYEAFSLGGSNSVRGYDEGDLGSGRSFVLASVEYRFPVFSVISGALFFDAATDLGSGDRVPGDPAGVRNKPGSGFGYGIGVRVQSPLGPIRIDYGFNDQGDSRLHFGIGERF